MSTSPRLGGVPDETSGSTDEAHKLFKMYEVLEDLSCSPRTAAKPVAQLQGDKAIWPHSLDLSLLGRFVPESASILCLAQEPL